MKISNYIRLILIPVLVVASLRVTTNKTFKLVMDDKFVVTDTIRGTEYNVTATCYYPVSSHCDSEPLTTAGMYKINPDSASEYKWIAMSRDLIARWNGEFKYGDLVEIKGAGHKDGVYRVVDTMNKRFANRIDFLETKNTKPYKFTNVKLNKVTWKQKNLLASL